MQREVFGCDPEPDEGLRARIAVERKRAEARAQERELRALVSRRAQIEAVRDAIRDAARRLELPPPAEVPIRGGPEDEEYPVLVLSDWHVGQETDELVNAGFAVSVETARRQVDKLIRALARLWEIRHRVTPWRELTILVLGDMGQGMLRPFDRRHAHAAAQQVVEVALLLARVIHAVRRLFARIRVVALPGNHMRLSERPGIAGLDAVEPIESLDWLAVEALRMLIGEYDGNEVRLPAGLSIENVASYITVLEVAGWRIVAEHGAQIRGGTHGGLPFYPIHRAATQVRTLVAPVDLEFDECTTRYLRQLGDYYLFVLGHFHRPALLPQSWGWVVVNGALPPTTPFTAATQHAAQTPVQWLLTLHPRRGLTAALPLYADLPEWRGLGVQRSTEIAKAA